MHQHLDGSHSLIRYRGTKQRAPKQVRAAIDVHGHHRDCLGHRDDVYRFCSQLRWSLRLKNLPRTF